MSKRAEEAALKAYPDYPTMNGGYVTQRKPRKVFIQGYEQAEKETIERAIAWLEENVLDSTASELFDALRQAMEQEPKNYRVRLAEMPVVTDTAITWRDIKRIVTIADDILPDPRYKQDLDASFQSEEAYYKEVLRRYMEEKK